MCINHRINLAPMSLKSSNSDVKAPLLSSSPADWEIPYPNGDFPRNVSWISALTFSWVTPLMKAGYAHPLREEDVFRVPPVHECHNLTGRLESRFLRTFPNLFRAIREEWTSLAIRSGLWKIFNDGAQFAGPLFMSAILSELGSVSPNRLYLMYLAVGMYLSQIIGGIGEGQYFQNGMLLGMQLRSSLIALIFKKSLRLNVNSRMHGVAQGKVTNMISSDTESLQSFCEVMHVLWSAPLRIVGSMVLLYWLLGVAALAGVAVLLSLIPLQKKLVNLMTKKVREAQKFTDERLGMISETYEGIQLVKSYVWESSFANRTVNVRNLELEKLRQYSLIRAGNFFIISAIPVFVAVVSFATYTVLPTNPPLSAVQAFTALSLFGIIRFPLMQLPNVVNSLGACKVALGRITDYLLLEELPDAKTLQNASTQRGTHKGDNAGTVSIDNAGTDTNAVTLRIHNACFKWPSSPFELKNISLDLCPGDLLVVVGETASGKSSLLDALLGHMPQTDGSLIPARTSVCFCSQSAWIFNATVRENICFSSPFDPDRYWRVVNACSLETDLLGMPSMDLTEIGEKGVNLSGGQKQRISLARALYSEGKIALLDDPLAALDSTVARRVFREAILCGMSDRAVVLVTNRLEVVLPFCKNTDRVVKFLVLNKQKGVVGIGNLKQVSEIPEFIQLVKDLPNDAEERCEVVSGGTVIPTSAPTPREAGIIKKEERQIGAVSNGTIFVYISALGYFFEILALYGGTEIARVCASVWLSRWANNAHDDGDSVFYYLSVYVMLSGVQLVFLLGSQISGALCGNSAARKLHEKMYNRLLYAPMSFFNATPLGRILNRFSKDVADMDRNLSPMMGMTLTVTMTLISTLVVLGVTAYYTVIVCVPILVLFYWCQEYYRSSSREIKRMDSISRSPIYAHFQQIQDGIYTVLAYNKADYVLNQNYALVDNHIRFNLAQMSSNRWLGVRLELYGGALVLVTALFIVGAHISVGIAGLALSTALQVTGALGGIVRLSAMLENSLNSVERISEYSAIEVEATLGSVPPTNWPSFGGISFSNVVAKYRGVSEPVLKNISFRIVGGNKVGIVGRTGAGKTSLIQTIFRIMELENGKIEIDGIDISKLVLASLRRVLGIIPQDPIVFEGTLRSNLDPFGTFSDTELKKGLESAHLATSLDLNQEIVRGGHNLSAGQRQQICLARVVIRKPKILVLDEATSSLDAVTDQLVVGTIKEEFKTSTVLTIAHRLQTIIDSDWVMVMDKGIVAEAGNPNELIKIENGMFAKLVQEAGRSK